MGQQAHRARSGPGRWPLLGRVAPCAPEQSARRRARIEHARLFLAGEHTARARDDWTQDAGAHPRRRAVHRRGDCQGVGRARRQDRRGRNDRVSAGPRSRIAQCEVAMEAYSTLASVFTVLSSADGPGTTGHVWDEDLAEYNNPLPRWWMWMFYLTIAFSLGYLVFYPGLGNLPGILGWSSAGAYASEVRESDERTGPLYAKYM